MNASNRFSVLRRAVRLCRSKRTILFFFLFALTAVTAAFRLTLQICGAVDLLSAAGNPAKPETCLRPTAIALCAATAAWIASACKSRIVRDAALVLRGQLSEMPSFPASANAVSELTCRIDRLAEDLFAASASLLFRAAAAAVALAYMLRFSVGASIPVVLLAPLCLLAGTRRIHGSPPQSDLWDRMTLLLRESVQTNVTVFRREAELLCAFDDVNARLQVCAQHGIFAVSLRAPTAGFIRRVIFAAAMTTAALGTMTGSGSAGSLICFLICTVVYLRSCAAVPGILRKYRSVCADAAQVFALLDARDEKNVSTLSR